MAQKAAGWVSGSPFHPSPRQRHTGTVSRSPAEEAEVQLCWAPGQEVHPVCLCCKGVGGSIGSGAAAAVGQQQGQQQQHHGGHAAHRHTHGGLRRGARFFVADPDPDHGSGSLCWAHQMPRRRKHWAETRRNPESNPGFVLLKGVMGFCFSARLFLPSCLLLWPTISRISESLTSICLFTRAPVLAA